MVALLATVGILNYLACVVVAARNDSTTSLPKSEFFACLRLSFVASRYLARSLATPRGILIFTSPLSSRHSFSIPIPCTGLFGSWVEGLLRPTPKSGTNFGCTQFTRYSLLLDLRRGGGQVLRTSIHSAPRLPTPITDKSYLDALCSTAQRCEGGVES